MILRESTKPQHDAAEQTLVGASMADGTISPQWWADWLGAVLVIHASIDPYLPECLRRTLQLCNDLDKLGIQPRHCRASLEYALTLSNQKEREGAEYVFTGAHLMGGAIIYKRLGDRLPATHLQWDNRQDAIATWSPLRDREDLIEPAQRAFGAVLNICEQIVAHDA